MSYLISISKIKISCKYGWETVKKCIWYCFKLNVWGCTTSLNSRDSACTIVIYVKLCYPIHDEPHRHRSRCRYFINTQYSVTAGNINYSIVAIRARCVGQHKELFNKQRFFVGFFINACKFCWIGRNIKLVVWWRWGLIEGPHKAALKAKGLDKVGWSLVEPNWQQSQNSKRGFGRLEQHIDEAR